MKKSLLVENVFYEMLLEVSKKSIPRKKPEELIEALIQSLYLKAQK